MSVAGNHYFDAKTLEELLSVHAADPLDRHGTYSQALVAADVSALQAVYQNNGFSQVKVTPETLSGGRRGEHSRTGERSRVQLNRLRWSTTLRKDSSSAWEQLKLDGAVKSDQSKLLALMNTCAGAIVFAAEPGRRPRRAADRLPEPRL